MVAVDFNQSLSDNLKLHGFTHRPAENQFFTMDARDILNKDGAVVFTGDSRQTWVWLEHLTPLTEEIAIRSGVTNVLNVMLVTLSDHKIDLTKRINYQENLVETYVKRGKVNKLASIKLKKLKKTLSLVDIMLTESLYC